MRGRGALLYPTHMKPRRGEVDLAPLQVDQFGSPQAVAEGDQDHGGVPMALAVALDRCHYLLDLGNQNAREIESAGISTSDLPPAQRSHNTAKSMLPGRSFPA